VSLSAAGRLLGLVSGRGKAAPQGLAGIPNGLGETVAVPVMIKCKGKYIVSASEVAGWGGPANDFAVALSPVGPWGKKNVLSSENNSWGGQITSLLYLEESDTVMVMFDQCSTSAGHGANIDFKLGRKLRWDGLPEQFIDDPEANKMLTKEYRKPWKIA